MTCLPIVRSNLINILQNVIDTCLGVPVIPDRILGMPPTSNKIVQDLFCIDLTIYVDRVCGDLSSLFGKLPLGSFISVL